MGNIIRRAKNDNFIHCNYRPITVYEEKGSPYCVWKKVRAIRIKRGFSQEQLAYKVRLDRSYIGKIERGETNTTLLQIHKIAQGLGVKTKDLISF